MPQAVLLFSVRHSGTVYRILWRVVCRWVLLKQDSRHGYLRIKHLDSWNCVLLAVNCIVRAPSWWFTTIRGRHWNKYYITLHAKEFVCRGWCRGNGRICHFAVENFQLLLSKSMFICMSYFCVCPGIPKTMLQSAEFIIFCRRRTKALRNALCLLCISWESGLTSVKNRNVPVAPKITERIAIGCHVAVVLARYQDIYAINDFIYWALLKAQISSQE